MRRQVRRVEAHIRESAPVDAGQPPVLFFNASTRIHRLSLNAAYQLLAGWGVRLSGLPVTQVVCTRGMQQCVLGVDRRDLDAAPPCRRCTAFSGRLYPPDSVLALRPNKEWSARAAAEIPEGSLAAMGDWEFAGLPLGGLVMPSLRWILRRHDLEDDAATRHLLRRLLVTAASLAGEFDQLLEAVAPRSLVVFNVIFFPESGARPQARRRGVPVVTHEVGLRPFSAFFSHAEATFRQPDFEASAGLDHVQQARLDSYLAERFSGKFSMAGIEFWPEIQALPAEMEAAVGDYRQMVAIFANVVFDTSQVHANTHFASMFEWLEDLESVIRRHADTLFVLRAHPDEDRPGKASRQSVADWVRKRGLDHESNVRFFGPSQYVNSYDLIRRAKFAMVYNSSVGLEASILGKPVLCAGRARYTQAPTVTYPASRAEYARLLEDFLGREGLVAPAEHQRQARIFLYDELYRASLDLSEFLAPDPGMPGMVRLQPFAPERLAQHPSLAAIVGGIRDGTSFSLP